MHPEDAQACTQICHEFTTAITVVVVRSQLMQRQLLRATGLTNLERELLLGNAAATLASVRGLSDHVATLQRLSEQPAR